jgi:hypothetical protein
MGVEANQIQSPALDFADRRVNLRSAMHYYNENVNVKNILSVNELDANINFLPFVV